MKNNAEAIYPLSPQQQGMLFEHLYAVEAGMVGVHIEQFMCILQGDLDIRAFEQAWQGVLDRHPILRTAFAWKNQPEPLQVVLRQVDVPFVYVDWCALAASEQQTRTRAYLADDRQRGFDLSAAPLMRVAVLQLGEQTYQVIWTSHHILLDGWCQPLLLNEVFSLYLAFHSGQDVRLETSRPYRDYIAWLSRQDLAKTRQFWQDTLRGFTRPTPLGRASTPDAFEKPAERYGYVDARLPAAATRVLQSLAQQHHLTMNTLVQGVWALLLSRYSGQEEVVFGVTISGRPPDLPGVETMIGLFINTLPLRVRVPPQATCWAWLSDLQAQHLALQHYGYCSAGQVHQWSDMPGALPLYSSLLVFENYPVQVAQPSSTDIALRLESPQFIGAQTNHVLTFLAAVAAEVKLQLVYDRHGIDSAGISQVLEHFLDLLKVIAAGADHTLASLTGRIPAHQIPAIPAPFEPHAPSAPFSPARTPTEQTLARIWAEMLGVERVGIHQSFVELGGHSLLAIELISRLRSTFQLDLPLRVLFEAPTIAEMAALIAQEQAALIDAESLGQILAELEQLPEPEEVPGSRSWPSGEHGLSHVTPASSLRADGGITMGMEGNGA